jgi:hypothetical protein
VPDLPKVDSKGVAKRKAVYTQLFSDHPSKLVDSSFVRAAQRFAKSEYDESYADAVGQTLQQYMGEKLSARTISLIASQLAARHDELVSGPIAKFSIANVMQEWVSLEILGLQQAVWRETKPGIQLKLECLSGTPAGHIFDRKLPLNWLNFLAYQIGFSRRMVYPDDQPWLFQGLQFWGSMVKLDDKLELDFVDFAVSNGMKKYNKDILKLRLRYELDGDIECPREFTHECSSCQVSFKECPAAPRHQLPLQQMVATTTVP